MTMAIQPSEILSQATRVADYLSLTIYFCVPVCSISFEKFLRAKWLQRCLDGIPLSFISWLDNLIRFGQLNPLFQKQPNPFLPSSFCKAVREKFLEGVMASFRVLE